MISSRVFLILATTAVVCLSVSLAASAQQASSQAQRDQMLAAQQQQQQQQFQPEKSGGGRVTRREYAHDNSYWAIGLILVPLLILLCFPLFSTPYGHGYGGGHGGHHHGGWGWGRSATDKLISPEVQERVLKSVEKTMEG